MENYCESISKYHVESPEEAYSEDSPVHPGYSSSADDAQYFDIDISLPFSPTDTSSPISSSDDDDGEDEFELDLSICTADSPNPNPCISPVNNLLYQGQLLPLQIPTASLDDTDKDNAFPQSCNVPGVKIHLPKLLKTATKLKISLLGFRKSAKPVTGLQSPCAEYGTGGAMDSPVPKQKKLFTVKLKVVEVPLVSLFTRDNSKGSKRDINNHRFQKKSEDSDDGGQCKIMGRDKKRAKEIVQKYVQKIKPLYVKISQRCSEKMRSGGLEKSGERNGVKNATSPGSGSSEKQMPLSNFSGNLKMVYKNLGKGKQQPSDMRQKLPNYGSESTLMEVQSAIQGAITHCKQCSYSNDTINYQNSGCSAES